MDQSHVSWFFSDLDDVGCVEDSPEANESEGDDDEPAESFSLGQHDDKQKFDRVHERIKSVLERTIFLKVSTVFKILRQKVANIKETR